MRKAALSRQRLSAAFAVGMLLLFSPVITLMDRAGQWHGVPLLYLYLFGVWGLLIAAMALILTGRDD